MTERERAVRDILARAKAAGKRVFAYTTRWASCAEVVKGKVSDETDRMCVEGDERWEIIPAAEGEQEQAA